VKVSCVSILICTYNRASLLRETLAAVQELARPSDCGVELVIVDNNSTDDTALAVSEATRISAFRIVYLQEKQQGKSFALNRGLQHAHGEVIALTDDDVLPARDWLTRIVEIFRTRQVTFVFGKVLPRWGQMPPPELLTIRAQDIWGPLAIVDYGDQSAEYRAENIGQRLPIGANLALARSAIVAVGGWRTDLGKVNNTLISGEDHEIFMRLRRHGLYAGFYDPAIVVRHYVPAGRLTRRYFRRWFLWHGRTHALMLDELFSDLDMSRVQKIGGVPRFLYRQALQQCWRYVASLPADPLETLVQELRVLQYCGLVFECWRAARRGRLARVAAKQRAPVLGALER
jgi:glucosyl-dolichyl phosphate glucuronosyltransferase